jgi:DNA-3-methyladenine glycosylase II
VLIRGAGAPDVLPLAEPRLRRAVVDAYGLERPPTDVELEELAERWRPFRSWVAFLLRRSVDSRPARSS